jgi:hypothetical protein
MTNCQPFAKLKEVFCQRISRPKNTTFNFAQPHDSNEQIVYLTE